MMSSHAASTLDGASTPRFRKCSDYVAGGAIHGAAAWSAYAVVEFIFSSVVFRVTRPYAIFTAWHWKLTGLLLIGFLTVGPLLGALAGFLIWRLRDGETVRVHPARVLELSACLTLTLAFTINLVAAAHGLPRRRLLAAARRTRVPHSADGGDALSTMDGPARPVDQLLGDFRAAARTGPGVRPDGHVDCRPARRAHRTLDAGVGAGLAGYRRPRDLGRDAAAASRRTAG